MRKGKIDINERFFVELDGFNYTLKENKTGVNKKTKEEIEYETTIGYYGNLGCALYRVMEIMGAENAVGTKTLGEYVELQKEILTFFKNHEFKCVTEKL